MSYGRIQDGLDDSRLEVMYDMTRDMNFYTVDTNISGGVRRPRLCTYSWLAFISTIYRKAEKL